MRPPASAGLRVAASKKRGSFDDCVLLISLFGEIDFGLQMKCVSCLRTLRVNGITLKQRVSQSIGTSLVPRSRPEFSSLKWPLCFPAPLTLKRLCSSKRAYKSPQAVWRRFSKDDVESVQIHAGFLLHWNLSGLGRLKFGSTLLLARVPPQTRHKQGTGID